MRQHRVWNDVYTNSYANPHSKSFGGEFTQRINIGSSSRHSDHLASISVQEDHVEEDWSVFTLYVDSVPTKRKAFNRKTCQFVEVPQGECVMDAVAAANQGEGHAT